jgi:CubicO group peptidase (beta-lactamase class C family)
LQQSFQEPDSLKPRRTRAVVVVRDGWVVAERYAPGITAATPLIGWSVTKAVTHALIGIAIEEKLLKLEEAIPVPEWTSPADPRRAITLDQLLRMSSGLTFSEVYDDFESDVVTMLLQSADSAAYAANKPLAAKPGTVWHYSSGTTNLIARGLRLAMADDEAYWRFPYARLFQPIGMHSAVLETDPAGTFVGSSLAYATARDWARFGLLYLQDGRWGDRRLLPEGWVEHATRPTPGSDQKYGAHWGLNRGGRYPDIPRDAFYAKGFGGQLVLVVPSRNVVIVRLGQTPGDGFDVNTFTGPVLKAL